MLILGTKNELPVDCKIINHIIQYVLMIQVYLSYYKVFSELKTKT